jgi:hypothetical protein
MNQYAHGAAPKMVDSRSLVQLSSETVRHKKPVELRQNEIDEIFLGSIWLNVAKRFWMCQLAAGIKGIVFEEAVCRLRVE